MSAETVSTARDRLYALGLPALGIAAALGLWWGVVDVFNVLPVIVPSPVSVVQAFGREPEYLAVSTGQTMYRLLVGFAVAAAGGLLVALLLSWSRVLERAVMPLFLALNAIPKVAVAPLLLVWMGFGPAPNIVMVVLICFLPVVVSTMAGLGSTPADLGELARSLRASWLHTYYKVRLPWALPHVFVGLKLAISLAVIGAVVAEIANPNSGLGAIVVVTGQTGDTPLAFAAIAVLSVAGVLLYYAVAAVERALLPWARQITG